MRAPTSPQPARGRRDRLLGPGPAGTGPWRRSVLMAVCGALATTSCSGVPSDVPPTARGVTVRPVDGGPDFHAGFSGGLPSDPSFFPLAVWSESVVDDTGWPVDRAAGLNVYLEPTADSDLPRIAEHGMHAITSNPGGPSRGFFTLDEADMWAGPGDAAWTGNGPGQGDICSPRDNECGYSAMALAAARAPAGALRVTNYGKGVVFWETDTEAARFVNDFQDVVSADVYWFTDPGVCGPSEGGALLGDGTTLPDDECRLAANYGRTVERVRSLVEPPGSRPVWNVVEVGHPFREEHAPTITIPQIRAAVWSSLIAGARGIVYFVHNFAGPCPTQHAIRDCGEELQRGIAAIDRDVTDLAPVLNAPFVDGLVNHDDTVNVSVKIHDGALYLLTGSATAQAHTATMTVGCAADSATVVGENRTIPVVDGKVTDEFADGNAVHIYRLDGADRCFGGRS
ncbi:hypothetical protein HQ602_09385 [Rhodococcus kroppenstedtii]|uniref:hypothetical protein n=1 Tax=Rhodococcoides kroppenstedtii TaxID=293050 RepID=UPI001C9A5EFE|nr:hypothetical protein [Rhodococcus kroppenstedtii]MBY6436595.1 hypothetical protein [Rhodococcus kroppenstedtii]